MRTTYKPRGFAAEPPGGTRFSTFAPRPFAPLVRRKPPISPTENKIEEGTRLSTDDEDLKDEVTDPTTPLRDGFHTSPALAFASGTHGLSFASALSVQRMSVGGEDVVDLSSRREHGAIQNIWQSWLADARVAFDSWEEATKFALLAFRVSQAVGKDAQADVIADVLRTEGSARYRGQVRGNEAGSYEHHVAVLDLIQHGYLRDVEQYMRSAFGVFGRYLDATGQTGAYTFHLEVKDYALNTVASESQQKSFRKQLMDNIIWVSEGGPRAQRYRFAKGVPKWAHDIVANVVARYKKDFPKLVTDLDDFPNYDVQAENAAPADVDFWLDTSEV